MSINGGPGAVPRLPGMVFAMPHGPMCPCGGCSAVRGTMLSANPAQTLMAVGSDGADSIERLGYEAGLTRAAEAGLLLSCIHTYGSRIGPVVDEATESKLATVKSARTRAAAEELNIYFNAGDQ